MINDLYYHPTRNTQEVAQVFATWVEEYYIKTDDKGYSLMLNREVNEPDFIEGFIKYGNMRQLYECWLKQEAL